jgi:hypothetical protein
MGGPGGGVNRGPPIIGEEPAVQQPPSQQGGPSGQQPPSQQGAPIGQQPLSQSREKQPNRIWSKLMLKWLHPLAAMLAATKTDARRARNMTPSFLVIRPKSSCEKRDGRSPFEGSSPFSGGL